MSQTVVPSTDRPGGGPVGTPLVPAQSGAAHATASAGGLRGRLGRAFEDTPGKLRAAAVIGVLASLVFAGLGGNAFLARGAALEEARNDGAQLVRVQQIATDLTQADALVTNAFLLGAQEPPTALQQYQQLTADASLTLTQAAQAQPGDATALGVVNKALTQYTAAVAAARVNNRLGYEVGSAYLRQASTLLRTTTADQPAILPTLQAVVDADAGRVDDAFGAARLAGFELALAGLVVLAGLLAVQIWLARRTHRRFNVPLTAGTLAVLVALGLGAFIMISSQSAADRVRDTSYAATRAVAQARIAAFDAKSNESLTLVYRGTGQTYESQYKADLNAARAALGTASTAGSRDAGLAQLETWNTLHQTVRAKDDAGDTDAAVTAVTATGPNTASAAFADFGDRSAAALSVKAGDVSRGLDGSHWLLVVLGWLTLLVGIFAAATAWWGVSQRLEEYR